MIEIELFEEKIEEIEADCEVVFIVEKDFKHRWIKDRDELEFLGFKGESDEVVFLPHKKRVYVACDSFDSDDIRLAISSAIKTVSKTKISTLKIGLYTKKCPPINARALSEGIVLGSYEFDRYRSKKNEKNLKKIKISCEDYNGKIYNYESTKKAIDEGIVIANATNDAKDVVNTPPYEMTPQKLAEYAQEMAKELEDVELFIGDEKFLKEQNMGAFLAVAKASSNTPRLIKLSYKPKNAKKRFVFVGKGLTYDSGGLSLKPSEHMTTMKSDKSGAVAAMHIIKVVSKLKFPFEVHAVIGAAENMIGGNAYKPDDILTARNGKTIEVKNTDAEGRLVLADCLDYAQDLKPDYIVDLATLTGACVVALGEYTTGIMGHSTKLKHSMALSAKKSGELAGALPFNRYLKKLLKSSIADISNISSSRYGGAITAALFLDNFIKDEYKDSWLHLDIAGPAFVQKAWGYNQDGASGAGVRMCVYWLKEFLNELNKLQEGEK